MSVHTCITDRYYYLCQHIYMNNSVKPCDSKTIERKRPMRNLWIFTFYSLVLNNTCSTFVAQIFIAYDLINE